MHLLRGSRGRPRHRHHPDRAQHARGRGGLRPGHRARSRREDRRGLPRAVQSDARDRSLHLGKRGAGPRASLVLKVESLDVSYGEIRALKGVGLEVGQGEIVTLLGKQRSRQDDHAQDDLRASPSIRPAAPSPLEDRSLLDVPPTRSWRGRRARPRGTADLQPSDRPQNLTMGAYLRSDAGIAGTTRAGLPDCSRGWPSALTRSPAPCRAASADAHASGAPWQNPEAPAAGRAGHGLGACPRGADLRHDHRYQPPGHDDLAGRAERRHGALDRASRSRPETGSIALTGTAAELSDNADVRRAYLGE